MNLRQVQFVSIINYVIQNQLITKQLLQEVKINIFIFIFFSLYILILSLFNWQETHRKYFCFFKIHPQNSNYINKKILGVNLTRVMYRSLMFKSNPLTEELNRHNQMVIKTLEVKNYSFAKIGEKLRKKSLKSQQKTLSYNIKKKNGLQNPPQVKKSKNFNYKISSTNNKQTLNPESQFINCIQQQFNNYSDKNLKFTSNKRRLLKTNKKLSRTNQQPVQIKNKAKNINVNQIADNKQLSFNRLIKQPLNKSFEIKKYGNFVQQKLERQQKNQIKKQNLYNSINLDNLFDRIEQKVNKSQKEKKSKLIENRNIQILEKLRKQVKTPTPKTRTPFDHFNLNFLINKKKNLQIQNSNLIQGSSMPYYQSLTSRSRTSCKKNRYEAETQDQTHYNSKLIKQSWQNSKRRKASIILMDDNGVIQEKDIQYQNEQGYKKEDQQNNNLRMSLKISALRQMFKNQKLQFS